MNIAHPYLSNIDLKLTIKTLPLRGGGPHCTNPIQGTRSGCKSSIYNNYSNFKYQSRVKYVVSNSIYISSRELKNMFLNFACKNMTNED